MKTMWSRKFLYKFISLSLFLSLACTLSAQAEFGKAKLNFTDEQGRRQGYWKITGSMTIEDGYKDDQLVEEGEYVDNKREGLWRKFYPSGKIRSEIEFENNHPRGAYRIYYPSGKVEEEGHWAANKNTGSFKRYHENGKLSQDFHFNRTGKRDGLQKYYYPSGHLRLTVEVKSGVAEGMYNTYYPDGSLKMEKKIVGGVVDSTSVKIYPPTKEEYADLPEIELPPGEATEPAKDQPNLQQFNATGQNTLYNQNKQVTQVGEFRDGRLWNGKWNRYDSNGILHKVEVYREGKFIGYGLIEKDNR